MWTGSPAGAVAVPTAAPKGQNGMDADHSTIVQRGWVADWQQKGSASWEVEFGPRRQRVAGHTKCDVMAGAGVVTRPCAL